MSMPPQKLILNSIDSDVVDVTHANLSTLSTNLEIDKVRHCNDSSRGTGGDIKDKSILIWRLLNCEVA